MRFLYGLVFLSCIVGNVTAEAPRGRYAPPSTDEPTVQEEWTDKQYCEELEPWVRTWINSWYGFNGYTSELQQWMDEINLKRSELITLKETAGGHPNQDEIESHCDKGLEDLANEAPVDGPPGAESWLKSNYSAKWCMDVAVNYFDNTGLRWIPALDENLVPIPNEFILVVDAPNTWATARSDLEAADDMWRMRWSFEDECAKAIQRADAHYEDAWGAFNSY